LGEIGDYSLLGCNKCGLQLLDPIPDNGKLENIYSDYYARWGMHENATKLAAMKRKTFQGYMKMIIPHVSSGRSLDIGCATGELMLEAQEQGFDVYGVEISPPGITRCRELFGDDRIIGKELQDEDFPEEYFDLITLSDVIEHVSNPPGFIELLDQLLKPKGMLMIVTPDTSSWTRKIMRMHWGHYKQEHLYYYNRSNIKRFLEPFFDVIISKSAKKTLTPSYFVDIMRTYSRNRFINHLAELFRFISSLLRVSNLKINIGEMLILCRKK
jgi:2-polyprenyl-3-methyl-5-hydroxy-6-metoxy-1,4-benzoquinol methylase